MAESAANFASELGFKEIVIDNSLKVQTTNLGSTGTVKDGFGLLGKQNLEAISDDREIILSKSSGFVNAVYLAFNHHIPLCFGPDDLWNLIAQGVSTHIEQNAEELRDKFVDFDGKKVLRIHRDGFVKGSPNNDWAGCFEEWSSMITDNIGKENTNNLVPNFSTTGHLERALHELTLMDCMKSYFDFRCSTCCGISKVKLMGTLEDWKALQEMVSNLRQYDLDWWIDHLQPVVDKIVKTYEGEQDSKFWYTIYKKYSTHGSGASTYVTGWITTFFPYIKKNKRRQFPDLEELKKGRNSGSIEIYDVPNNVTSTPFVWEYLNAEIPMNIYGGFAGCVMDGEYIRPVLAWGVGPNPDGQLQMFINENGAIRKWNTETVLKWLSHSNSVMQEYSSYFEAKEVQGELLLDRWRLREKLCPRKGEKPAGFEDKMNNFCSELKPLMALG